MIALPAHRRAVFDRRAAQRRAGISRRRQVSHAELAGILRDLARFNGVMHGHWPVLRWLDRAMRDVPREHL